MPTLDVESGRLMRLFDRSLHQALAADQRVLQHERRTDIDFGPLAQDSERGLADPARELGIHPFPDLLDVLGEKTLVFFSRRQEDQKDIPGLFVQRNDVVRAQLVALELGHDLTDHVHQVFVLAAPIGAFDFVDFRDVDQEQRQEAIRRESLLELLVVISKGGFLSRSIRLFVA